MATAADASSAACEVDEGARDSALRLLALLQAVGADPGRQKLAEQIIRSIDRALAAVRDAAAVVDKRKRRSAQGPDTAPPPPGPSKRRAMCRGETRARVVSATTDDGFAWRKYGEKVINRGSCRRFYFRCTYRDDHDCSAKKQVQQAQEDPSLFETLYFGEHTPACPRGAPLAVADADSIVVPQAPLLATFGRLGTCPAGEVPSLRAAAGEALMQPDVAEFSEEFWPVEDGPMKFVSADPSFPAPAIGVESFDDSLEELVGLFWS